MSTTDSNGFHVPVLWPDDVKQKGFAYGWRAPLLCVAGVLTTDLFEDAEAAMQRVNAVQDWTSFIRLCGSFPVILGYVTFNVDGTKVLEMFNSNAKDFSFVYYRRPRLRYLEMYALDATLTAGLRSTEDSKYSSAQRSMPDPWAHDFTKPVTASSLLLDQSVVNQINFGQAVCQTLLRGNSQVFNSSDQPAQAPVAGLHIDLMKPDEQSLIRFSTFGTQIVTRSRQLVFLYQRFPPPSYSRNGVSPETISGYVGFYNCLWLILNDIIIGYAIGTFIRENSSYLTYLLKYYIQRFLIEDIQNTLLWLNNWPAGLKLNTELSAMYCHSLLAVMTGWNHMLTHFVLPHLQNLVYITGVLGCFGMTVTVAFFSDVVALFTAHVHLCYLLSLAVFRQQLKALGSLWKLFRGKRRNVLRNRTDSWVFDVDQLLFGTILFTLLAFIYPTTMTYYALFAVLRLSTMSIYGVLDILLMLINRFPLFAVMLHIKDPLRLPGGLYFEVIPGKKKSLRNKTIPLSSIFSYYSAYWTSLARRRHPLRLLKRIFSAEAL